MGTLGDRVVVITGGGGASPRGVVAALAREGARIARTRSGAGRGSHASTNLPFMDHDEAPLDRILSVDVKGAFYCMQACFPYLRDSDGGRVINVSSAAGSERMAGFAAYAAATRGVRTLTGVAAREWGALGINVNAICPSLMTDGIR